MKNKIILLGINICFVCMSLAKAQSRVIRFEKTKWKQVLEKAKKEKKIIFLDCYTSWCGPCKWMEKNVYNNDTVADFYNSSFICVKMDMEKDEGFDLAKKYNITSYPTMLYINATGEVLHRTCESTKALDFIENGRNALDPQKQLLTFKDQFNSNAYDSKNAFQYFELLEKACLENDTIVEKYLLAQKDSNLTLPYNWKIIYKYANYSSRAFKYLETNKLLFCQLYGIDSVETIINQIYIYELRQANLNRNSKKFEMLKAKFLILKTKNAEKIIQRAELKLPKLLNADRKNAIEIQDSIVGPTNVSMGFGSLTDYQDIVYQTPGKGGMKESNSAWFKLNIDHDTILTFDIVPFDSLDDYDFAVFKSPVNNLIKDVTSIKIKSRPERLCYSYCTSKSGITGLSQYTKNKYVGSGAGPAYVSGIPVKAGETYYIYVDCFETSIKYNNNQVPLGFSIFFYDYWPKRKPIVLKNVFFENRKAVLPKESFIELDKLVVRLQESQINIEIRGHADGMGNEEQNKVLSEERAKAVVDYLLSKKVKADRLFYKGFGSTTPIASNGTEEGRQKNRRVEFIIVMN
ncbi:MAG: OmpA family protein [Bacteroidia bacterium]|nr:OmpA family protein [Bacteroidia bacterium]